MHRCLVGDKTLKLVHEATLKLEFVIAILRWDTTNDQHGKKTHVLLRCERGDKYKRYKNDLELTITKTKKCNYLFKLCGKPNKNSG